MKIYISGKISGTTDYKKRFYEAEMALRKDLGFGNDIYVFNPGMEQGFTNWTWCDYMRRDIKNLVECDAILMLRGWRRSPGARIEHYIANKLGLTVLYQKRRG